MRFLGCALLAVMTLFSPLSWAEEELTKEQIWKEMAAEVDTWGDGLGYPIDAGIKETVIVLNLLGITTVQSCEGHLNRGRGTPWVSVKRHTPIGEDLEEQLYTMREEYQKLAGELRAQYPDLPIEKRRALPEATPFLLLEKEIEGLSERLEKEEAGDRVKLHALLCEFYKDRTCSHEDMLMVDRISGYLQSVGARVNGIRDKKVKAGNLKQYQKEMKAFTAFLKERFFLKV